MTARLLLAASLMALASQAQAHQWYDFSCCSERDCRQTTLGEVERHDDGWYVVPLKLTVPFDDKRVRRSLDPLIHICLVPTGLMNGEPVPQTLRCLYVPEISG